MLNFVADRKTGGKMGRERWWRGRRGEGGGGKGIGEGGWGGGEVGGGYGSEELLCVWIDAGGCACVVGVGA